MEQSRHMKEGSQEAMEKNKHREGREEEDARLEAESVLKEVDRYSIGGFNSS